MDFVRLDYAYEGLDYFGEGAERLSFISNIQARALTRARAKTK